MKNILIVSNTYYQLIVALQLRFTLFKDDMVVLLMSDQSNNAESITKALKDGKYFDNTILIRTKCLARKKTIREKITNFYENINIRNNRYRGYLEDSIDVCFDEIITYNIDIVIYNLFSILSERNKKLIVSRYEEGILSYKTPINRFTGDKGISVARKMVGKPGIDSTYKYFYCFFPNLYAGELETVSIPKIQKDSILTQILQNIFSINKDEMLYTQKYIYFTSVYDFEGGKPIGEYDLVQELANRVGKENLLLKIHPRDSRDIYANSGIAIDTRSSVPWEAIQLSMNSENKIYLTATSGSVLAGSFLSSKPIKTYYLYKLCNIDGNRSAISSVRILEELLDNPQINSQLSNIKVLEKIEDIKLDE